MTRWPRCSGPAPRARRRNACLRTAASRRPPAAPASSRSRPRASPRRPRRSTRSCCTGRVRDQWRTMTRTGLSPRLSVHVAEPFVEIHPRDGRARLRAGHARARCDGTARRCCVMLSEGQQRARCSCRSTGPDRTARPATLGALVQPATDPSRASRRRRPSPPPSRPNRYRTAASCCADGARPTATLSYWAQAVMPAGFVTFIGFDLPAGGWPELRDRLLPAGERTCYEDARSGLYRAAVLREGRLEAVLYLSPGPTLPSLEWLKGQFAARGDPACRAARPAGGPRARRRGRRGTDRVRVPSGRPQAPKRRSRRAPLAERSATARAPAPTAAPASRNSSGCWMPAGRCSPE